MMNSTVLRDPNPISDQIMNRLKSDPSASKVCEHFFDGGKCDGWACSPAVMDTFSQKLAALEIPHACIQGDQDGSHVIFVTREKDRDNIREARRELLAETRNTSEVSLAQLKAKNIGGTLYSIRGVSETYAAVFKEEAKASGMHIVATDNRDGTYDIHYPGNERSKADVAIMNTVVATRGAIGEFNRERIAIESRAERDIYSSVLDAQKEFYVVSHAQPNEYMHFTSEGYKHYRNEQLIGDELRSNRNFQVDSHKKIDASFVRPVVLSKDEFEAARKLSREEYVKHISVKRKVVKPDREAQRKMELERMAKQIAEYKISMDNNYINTDFYNHAASVAAFESREDITDRQIDSETEMSISNPKSLPPDIQETIDKQQSLPLEERQYIDERVKEYITGVNEVQSEIEVIEVTREDLEEDLDLMIASFGENETRTETVEVERGERD